VQRGEVTTHSTYMRPFGVDDELTDVGYYIHQIKNALYHPTHRFGPQIDSKDRSAITTFFQDALNAEAAEDFTTIITVKTPNTVEMQGYFGETISIMLNQITTEADISQITHKSTVNYEAWTTAQIFRRFRDADKRADTRNWMNISNAPPITLNRIKLAIPMLPTLGNTYTYNSLFDVKGKLRIGYLNNNIINANDWETQIGPTPDINYNYDGKILKKQYIMPGYNSGINPPLHTLYYIGTDGITIGTDYTGYTVDGEKVINPYLYAYSAYITDFDDRLQDITVDPEFYIFGDFDRAQTAEFYENRRHRSIIGQIFSELPYATYLDIPSSVYLNFICDETDNNNEYIKTTERIATMLRAVTSELDRLLYVKSDVPNQALQRLVIPGIVPIKVLNNSASEPVYWQSELDLYRPEDGDKYKYVPSLTSNELDFNNQRKIVKLQNAPHPVLMQYETIDELHLHSKVDIADYYKYDLRNDYNKERHQVFNTHNIDAYVYLEGERFIGYEQLTSIIPSSFLFQAPRLGIKIDEDKIPARAKRLLIYRTEASHKNSYDPQVYGLVDIVDIKTANENILNRDEDGEIIEGTNVRKGERYTVDSDNKVYKGIYYFDKVKDGDLDMAADVMESEGLRRPIHSRINIALNERVYFANFKQYSQPEPPRKHEPSEFNPTYNVDGDIIAMEFNWGARHKIIGGGKEITPENKRLRNTHYYCFEAEPGKGFDNDTYVQYAYVYEDVTGIISQPEYTDIIDPCYSRESNDEQTNFDRFERGEVVLYYLPHAYDASITKLNIYRREIKLSVLETTLEETVMPVPSASGNEQRVEMYNKIKTALAGQPFYKVGSIDETNQGIFYDNNTWVYSEDKMPAFHPVFNDYESGVMYSEPYRPDFIKAENFFDVRSGDGTMITGMGSNFGNLIIAKEQSLHRKTVQGVDATVSRTDEISANIGCIAPETFITVDNIIYFLSYQGIYRYDGNQLLPIDMPIKEEIMSYLTYLKRENIYNANRDTIDLIRFVTAGYNPVYGELYFNFPTIKYIGDDKIVNQDGTTVFHNYPRRFECNIYVYHIATQIWTKYKYSEDIIEPLWVEILPGDPELELEEERNEWYIKKLRNLLQNTRIYYTNKLGELRSGDILATRYFSTAPSDPLGYNQVFDWAGIYIETPYQLLIEHIRQFNAQDLTYEFNPYLNTDDTINNHIFIQSALEATLNAKADVLVATTEPIVLSGYQVIDGVSVNNDSIRVLVKNQLNSHENGIYNPRTTAWVRTGDCNTLDEAYGYGVLVTSGEINGGKRYKILGNTTDNVPIDDPTLIQLEDVYVSTTNNIVLSGYQIIDGINIDTANLRILVQNQTNSTENGIYLSNTNAWSRSADCNTIDVKNHYVVVLRGNNHSAKAYSLKGTPSVNLIIEEYKRYLFEFQNYVGNVTNSNEYSFGKYIFPPRRAVPIKTVLKLKMTTLERETLLKRINRAVSNIYSEGEIDIQIEVNVPEDSDERISRNYRLHNFTFEPTNVTEESNPHPLTRVDKSLLVTNNNVLTTIPMAAVTGDELNYTIDDTNLKGISYTVKISTELRTQINEITLYLRPIHLYLQ